MRRIEKPWGYEDIFAEDNDKYLGKILYIKDGHRLSKQYHEVKDETVMVVEGKLTIELEQRPGKIIQIMLPKGHAYRVEPGTIHRFCASGGSDVKIIEVSTPEIEDVVRLEDDYGR
tara:strand:- start:122 stop:469 length:348 start_codon:yes stop_codon:yes gene_type:complete